MSSENFRIWAVLGDTVVYGKGVQNGAELRVNLKDKELPNLYILGSASQY